MFNQKGAHFDAVDEGDGGSGGRVVSHIISIPSSRSRYKQILVDVSASDTDGSLCMKGKKKWNKTP
jgi:hypothetical protein